MSEPTNVIQALAAVMRELPAIGKDSQASSAQGGYKYRGIEAITAHTQALFAKFGIVFVPRVVGYEIREITVNSKPWTDTVEQVEYDVYGPGGIEDRITVGPIVAIGRDNADKGGNKCLTQAYKYALIQTLCISDAKDDADQGSPEADTAAPDDRRGRAWARTRVAVENGVPKDTATEIQRRLDADIQTIEGAELVADAVERFARTGEMPPELPEPASSDVLAVGASA